MSVERGRLYTVTILGEEIPSKAFNYVVNCHQIKLRLNSALIFTVTATSEDLFAPVEGCLCLLGAIIIILHSVLAQYIEPLLCISSASRWKSPIGSDKSIAPRKVKYSLSYYYSLQWVQVTCQQYQF